MMENYIFSGTGHAVGKYTVDNKDIEHALEKGYLKGFNTERVRNGKNYQEFIKKNPGVSPFEYFAGHKMGFHTRSHVSPFPPNKNQISTQSALDLGVKAIERALLDADVHPNEIGAWIVSTVSPHEQAPGIAATIKAFFTEYTNFTPTYTLASGCTGFAVNLQRGVDFLICNPEVQHVVVAHTETMSSFLTRLTDFIPFVTFGDAATAVILSRKQGTKKEGVISIVNYQDLKMVDYVGVDGDWNLYMNSGVVRERAIVDIVKASRDALEASGWKAADIDILVPHQTGDAILLSACDELEFPHNKLYREVQKKHGNVSGLGIPLGFSLLKESGELKQGMKILSPAAGVGGEYGAFTYSVPEQTENKNHFAVVMRTRLKGKTALITGATGALGSEVAKALADRGCELVLHYNSNDEKAQELGKELESRNIPFAFLKADLSDESEVNDFSSTVKNKYKKLDYLVHTAAVTGSLSRASEVSHEELSEVLQINQFAPIAISKGLKDLISDQGTLLYTGSVAEIAQFNGSSAYVASKKGLHGFAASFAGEARSAGIRSIYYMIGLFNGGMTDKLNPKQIDSVMTSVNQEKIDNANSVAERIVRSLYIPKVINTTDSDEGVLVVRKDGFFL
ncbi:MAG: SDR family NAD(P)-dependent oxidoreductase [Bacteroidales bacterium]|nr:SDR family NAD(P)-dependent oxidoreductase [Bacteroidales bacterium]